MEKEGGSPASEMPSSEERIVVENGKINEEVGHGTGIISIWANRMISLSLFADSMIFYHTFKECPAIVINNSRFLRDSAYYPNTTCDDQDILHHFSFDPGANLFILILGATVITNCLVIEIGDGFLSLLDLHSALQAKPEALDCAKGHHIDEFLVIPSFNYPYERAFFMDIFWLPLDFSIHISCWVDIRHRLQLSELLVTLFVTVLIDPFMYIKACWLDNRTCIFIEMNDMYLFTKLESFISPIATDCCSGWIDPRYTKSSQDGKRALFSTSIFTALEVALVLDNTHRLHLPCVFHGATSTTKFGNNPRMPIAGQAFDKIFQQHCCYKGCLKVMGHVTVRSNYLVVNCPVRGMKFAMETPESHYIALLSILATSSLNIEEAQSSPGSCIETSRTWQAVEFIYSLTCFSSANQKNTIVVSGPGVAAFHGYVKFYIRHFLSWLKSYCIDDARETGYILNEFIATDKEFPGKIKGGTLIVCPMALQEKWENALEAHFRLGASYKGDGKLFKDACHILTVIANCLEYAFRCRQIRIKGTLSLVRHYELGTRLEGIQLVVEGVISSTLCELSATMMSIYEKPKWH